VLVIWASAFIAVRDLADVFSPGAMALGRQIVGTIALTLVAIWRRPRMPRGRDIALVVGYGVIWFGGYALVLALSGEYLDAGTTAMLVNVAPLIVAAVAGFALGEGYPRSLTIGLGIGFAGVVVIASGGVGARSEPIGILLGLIAAVFYAAGVLMQKVALRRVDPVAATWLGCLAGTVALLPFTPQLVTELPTVSAPALTGLVYLGVGPTAIAFLLWAFVLQRSTASVAASATLAVPAIVVGMSWLILHELPTVAGAIGGILCLVGVAWSRRRLRRT
jgi:drug/metabolite transporter (DMT)-like permease